MRREGDRDDVVKDHDEGVERDPDFELVVLRVG